MKGFSLSATTGACSWLTSSEIPMSGEDDVLIRKRPAVCRNALAQSPRVVLSSSGPSHEPTLADDATHAHTGGDAQTGPDTAPCAVLDADGVGHVLGVGRSMVYDLDRREALPSPITLSARRRRWVAAEIQAWLLHGAPKRPAWERVWPRIRKEMLR